MIVYYIIIMKTDTEQPNTKWKLHHNTNKVEGMIPKMEYDGVKKHKPKKNRLIQPSNLIALPIEAVINPLTSTNINPFPTTLPTTLPSLFPVNQEGFENPCKSMGEVFKPYIKFVDYLIIWLIDKPCIEYPTVFIDFIGKTICEFGTEISSPTPPPDRCDTSIKIDTSDKELIKNQFKIFLSIGISCFIVYNWYYLMFYNSFNKTTPVSINANALSTYNNVLGFILNYLIQPVSYLNWAILTFLPEQIKGLSNPRLIFIFIFLCIISIVRTSGALYMKALSNYFKRVSDPHSGGMITIMILSGVFSVFIALNTVSHLSFFDILKEGFGQSPNKDLQNSFAMFKNFSATSTIFFIPQLLSFIMRITFSIILIWIAGIMVFGYLFLYSFFGIPLYSSNSLKETFKEINSSINTSNTAPNLFESNKYYKTFNWFIEKIFTYFYEIVFIIFFFQGIINYSVNIKHAGLKPIIISMAGMCLVITAYILYYRYKLLQSTDSSIGQVAEQVAEQVDGSTTQNNEPTVDQPNKVPLASTLAAPLADPLADPVADPQIK